MQNSYEFCFNVSIPPSLPHLLEDVVCALWVRLHAELGSTGSTPVVEAEDAEPLGSGYDELGTELRYIIKGLVHDPYAPPHLTK